MRKHVVGVLVALTIFGVSIGVGQLFAMRSIEFQQSPYVVDASYQADLELTWTDRYFAERGYRVVTFTQRRRARDQAASDALRTTRRSYTRVGTVERMQSPNGIIVIDQDIYGSASRAAQELGEVRARRTVRGKEWNLVRQTGEFRVGNHVYRISVVDVGLSGERQDMVDDLRRLLLDHAVPGKRA